MRGAGRNSDMQARPEVIAVRRHLQVSDNIQSCVTRMMHMIKMAQLGNSIPQGMKQTARPFYLFIEHGLHQLQNPRVRNLLLSSIATKPRGIFGKICLSISEGSRS
jgi:hypothetical protein